MSEETYETTEEYQKETTKLFEYIQRRDEMHGLLKIAKPSKISALRDVIARLDNLIRQTEEIMDILARKFQLELEADREDEKLEEMYQAVKPELLEYLAEHNPEAYEKLKAELEALEAEEEID